MKHFPFTRSAKLSLFCEILDIKHFHLSTISQIFSKISREYGYIRKGIKVLELLTHILVDCYFSGKVNNCVLI